jgi:hypothetical protein
MLEALKARNEVAVQLPQDQPNSFISRLQRSTVCSVRLLGRCPRLLHFAPLALSNQYSSVPWEVTEPSMSLRLKGRATVIATLRVALYGYLSGTR